ncbi:MAG: hypothetical protein LBJ89_01860, partial [Holosporales bacterium]|nr:hypothetical protein [Holosporales bacterium]
TLWGVLKRHRDLAGAEQALFGEWNSRSNKTIFGRVNNLMDLVSVRETSSNFNARLKDDADSLLNFINSDEFILGNWFDQSNSCFGRLHELSLLLLPDILDSILNDSSHIKAAQALMKATLPYADKQVFEKCISLAQLIYNNAESSQNEIIDKYILELFELLFPLYLDVIIGRADTPKGEQVYAPLFARLHHLEAQSVIDADTGIAVADRLARLKTIHPKSIDQFLDYFNLVNGAEESSLTFCMADSHSVGTPYNISGSVDNTFFVLFDEIARKCRSKEEKFARLMSILGAASNSSLNNTVFGKLATIAAALPPSRVSTFKKFWLGEYPPAPGISLFSNLIEICDLLRGHKNVLEESAIDKMIQIVGIPGDLGTSSLFGAVSSINGSDDFDEFAHSFGVDLDADHYNGNGDVLGSCFYFVNMLKKLIIPELFQNYPSLCPNLHQSTITQMIENAEGNELQNFIQKDCAWRLNNLILPQIQGLRKMVSTQEILSYVGNPENTNYNELNLSSKIHRLIRNLTSKTLMLDWKQVYSMLFFGPDSLQSKIYEIHTHAKHGSFENLIGNLLSRDCSLLGLVNKCLHKIELEPLLDALCPYVSVDDDTQTKGDILQNFALVRSKFIGLEDDYKAITQVIGETYRPYQIKATTLTDMIGFIYDTLAHASSLFSFDELERYAGLVFGDEKGLLAQSNELYKHDNNVDIINITGRMFSSSNVQTMCSSCIQMYKGILAYIRNLVVDQNAVALHVSEYEGSFLKFLLEYQSAVKVLDAFITTAQKENMKFNVIGCLKQIFETEYSAQLAISNFSFLTAQHSDPSNSYFLLKNIVVNGVEATLQRTNKEFTELLHTLIVSQYVNLLTTDIQKEEGLEDALYVSEGKLLPAYSSATSLINDITNRIHSLEQVPQNLIGCSTDRVDKDNVVRLTIFGLVNEILQIISSPSFFVDSARLLLSSTPDVLSHWFFGMNRLIGTSYDASSTTSERTFFETLKWLVLLLTSPDVKNQQKTITDTIGNENIDRGNPYRSLFVILEEILKKLIVPYTRFFLNYNGQNNVGASLVRVHNLFKSTGYQNISSFQPLYKIGDPSIPTGFFYRLQDCIDAFQRDTHLELLPMSLFLAYSNALYTEAQAFISKMQFPIEINEVNAFTDHIEFFISRMLSLGTCEGCEGVVEFLRQTCACINNVAQCLSGNSNEKLITIFSNTSFGDVSVAMTALSQAIGNLRLKILANDSDSKLCIAIDSETEFSAIYEKIGLVQSAVSVFGTVVAHPFEAFSVNSMCQSLPDAITGLTNAIDSLSLQLKIPVVKYMEYNELNVKNFAEIISSTLDIFNNVQYILGFQNCVPCKDSILGTELLLDAMRRFVQKLTQINNFIGDSYTSQLAYQLYKVAQILNKTSAHAINIPLTKNAPREVWQVIAANLKITAENIQHVFTALNDHDNFQGIISVVKALYEQLNENFLNVMQISTEEELDILPEPEVFDAAYMRVALDWIVSSLNKTLQYWENSDMRTPLEDNWIIPLVESISQSYLSIEATLNQNLSYWTNEYNITDKIELIRTLLSQKIGPAIEDAIVDLKELCGRNFTEQVAIMACRIAEFCSMFGNVNPSEFLSTYADKEALLLMWAAKSQEIATIVEEAVRTTSTESDYCVHFTIVPNMNNLIAVLAEECAVASQVLPVPAPVSQPLSFDDAIAMITASLRTGNAWWQNVFSATVPLVLCQHTLSSALMKLQASYASIARGIAAIMAFPVCVYEDMQLGDIAQLFDARSAFVGNILQCLNSQLVCRSHVSQELNAIEHAICNITGKAIAIIDSHGIRYLVPYVST